MALSHLANEILLSVARVPFEPENLVPDVDEDLRPVNDEIIAGDESVEKHFADIKQQLQAVIDIPKPCLYTRIAEVQFPEANVMYPRDANAHSVNSLVFLMRKSKIIEAIISEAAERCSDIKTCLPNGLNTEEVIRAGLYIFDKLGSTCLRRWPLGSNGVLTSSLSLDALLVMRFTAMHLVRAAINSDQYATVVTKTLQREHIDLLAMALEDMLVEGLRDMRHLLLLGEQIVDIVPRYVTRERDLYEKLKELTTLHDAQTKLAQLKMTAAQRLNSPATVAVSMDPGAMARTLRMIDPDMWVTRGWTGRINMAAGKNESTALHRALADKGPNSLLAGISMRQVREGVVADMEDGKERLLQAQYELAKGGWDVKELEINEDEFNEEEDDSGLVSFEASGPLLVNADPDEAYLPEVDAGAQYDEIVVATTTAAGERLCHFRGRVGE